jgi:eukaryotic-like serine/threonine-protein kinase
MAAMSSALSDGQFVGGRYRVLRKLGSGGMGAVYEVLDTTTNRLRALKVMLPGVAPDADLVERFRREATVAGRVESDHVVEVFDAGFDEALSRAYFVMELLRGEDLGARIARQARLEPADVVECLAQVALGLSRTHAESIVHRDLKPENLFAACRDDGSLRMKILDFGIAKVLTPLSGEAKTTRAFGTPTYMAPEQLDGDGLIDERADLYALGHLAYTLLVGEAYYAREQKAAKNVFAYAQAVRRGAVEPPSMRASVAGVALPRAFDAWFARATHTDPQSRFGSAPQQIAALARALELPAPETGRTDETAGATEAIAVTSSARKAERRGASRIALAIGGALVLLGVIFVVQQRRGLPRASLLERSLPAVQVRAALPAPSTSADLPASMAPPTPASATVPRPVQSGPIRAPRASSAAKPAPPSYDPLDEL